ncbi:MAG: hypothetical protein ACRDJN_22485, partial [Chloroflexota bacterium]
MPRFVPRRWLVLLLGLLAFIFATSCAPAGAVASSGSTGARQAEESGRGVARTAPPAPANAPAAAPQPETAPSFTAEEALEHVSELAGTIGPRPAGSSAAVTAADYIAGELAGYGYQVERQPFTFPRFEDRTSTLTATAATAGPAAGDAPAGQSIEAGALVFSASGSVSGPLVFAGFGRPGDIPDGRMTGAIALMERGAEVTFRDKAAA